jgi:hypothetical protein
MNVKIDLKELEQLCSLQCTQAEIASFFGITVRAVEKRVTEDKSYPVKLDSGEEVELTFREIMQRGYDRGKISLRRAQFKLALEGNPALCIWLGKQLLGQREGFDVSGPGGKPLFSVEAIRAFMAQDDGAG